MNLLLRSHFKSSNLQNPALSISKNTMINTLVSNPYFYINAINNFRFQASTHCLLHYLHILNNNYMTKSGRLRVSGLKSFVCILVDLKCGGLDSIYIYTVGLNGYRVMESLKGSNFFTHSFIPAFPHTTSIFSTSIIFSPL